MKLLWLVIPAIFLSQLLAVQSVPSSIRNHVSYPAATTARVSEGIPDDPSRSSSTDVRFQPHYNPTIPEYRIVTCVGDRCLADNQTRLSCSTALNAIPDAPGSAALLVAVEEGTEQLRVTYGARVLYESIQAGFVAPIPWVALGNSSMPAFCEAAGAASPSRLPGMWQPRYIGIPFGTCCGACTFARRLTAVVYPPPLSCCHPCPIG